MDLSLKEFSRLTRAKRLNHEIIFAPLNAFRFVFCNSNEKVDEVKWQY